MHKRLLRYGLLFIVFAIPSCTKDDLSGIDFRDEMRKFVVQISDYAKAGNPDFIVIPQNGHELIYTDDALTTADENYLNAIDGLGQEELLFGWDNRDGRETDLETISYLQHLLTKAKNYNKRILVTDYTDVKAQVDESYYTNDSFGYISFAAPDRDMRSIPGYPLKPYRENAADVNELSQAKNFLYLINTEFYPTKQQFAEAVQATNYDVLIMDYFIEDTFWTAAELSALKTKANGGRRLVICYMSIGEAEDYRWYWQNDWQCGNPAWLEKENPQWKGNYKVRYWYSQWKSIIYGSSDAYLDRIVSAGFDGVYLDIIDGWEYYESRYK